jgi:hypothetical protein
VSFVFPLFLSFLCFDRSLEVRLFGFGHFAALVLSKKLRSVFFFAGLFRFRLVIVVENQKELASCSHNLRVRMFTSLPNCINSFIVVPNMTLVQFNHNIE